MTQFPERLLSGYGRFMDGSYRAERDRYLELADRGQKPETLIISCCDSRAAPETIFNCGPGELFVIRNVANLVPAYAEGGDPFSTAAAMEFSILALKIKDIVVMGHGRCGGISAALDTGMEPLSPDNFVGRWIEPLAPLSEQVRNKEDLSAAERQTALERVSIYNSIRNLRSYPYIKALEEKGDVTLHGAWFDISSGELWVMDTATGDFSRPGQ